MSAEEYCTMVSGVSQTASAAQDSDDGPAAGSVYFARTLTLLDDLQLDRALDEAALLRRTGNVIILGEPGMGKSELMRELGRRLHVEPVTATRFIHAKSPARFVQAGTPVLIDGLDEAMSRRDGDAIDAVLAQLEEAGAPPFILSCRSREWQARGVTNLQQLYGCPPNLLSLEPFGRDEARAFLSANVPDVDPDPVLAHLADHSLDELYRNPLTLGLMGRVAQTDARLPATRGALFERVCTLIWPEHDPDRQDEGLAQLAEEDALDAAGAIAASLLFAGAEAASIAGAAQVQAGDVRLADMSVLPGGTPVRAVFSSKLFHSVGPSRARPIHRVVAEFLGARWLARQASSPRARRRLLAQFHGSGGVPASLRGLHAWLAYHSPAMAPQVIAQDPYGVLRYGETGVLTPHLAKSLFDALCRLADDNPYFRAADWDSKTARALMIPALASEIEAIIASADSNAHLRSLLIEGLNGSPLSAALADTLETILLSQERFYRERGDAAEALIAHRDRPWCRDTITALTAQGGDDAPRLARQLIQVIDADVPADVLVATVFAELGVLSSPIPRGSRRRSHIARTFDRLIAAIPTERLVAVLDTISDYAELLGDGNWEQAGTVADIKARLILRALDEAVIGSADAALLWRWLATIERAVRYHRSFQLTLAQRLSTEHDLRRAVQAHALADHRREDSLWLTELDLQRRLVGLSQDPGDVIVMLERLAEADNRDAGLRQDWKDLVQIAMKPGGLAPDVRAAAELFRRGDKPLGDYLCKIENPKKPAWELRQEKEAAKRARAQAVSFEIARRSFERVRDDLRAGTLGAILQPAEAYLDRFHELSGDLPPHERLETWLGADLCRDALAGFEAVLHRNDLPTPPEVADGFAAGTIYNYGYPIMAGLYERLRTGVGLANVSATVKQVGLLLCHDNHGWTLHDETFDLQAALEAELLTTPEARQAFARLWIEPALAARSTHVPGLYMLARDPAWQETGAALAGGWLAAFPEVPEMVEVGLVDCLTYGNALEKLRVVADARTGTMFRNIDHLLSWLAIDVLVRFDEVAPDLQTIATDFPDFLWFLRNRVQFERRGEILPLTVAQSEWIVTAFRGLWPHAVLDGMGSGNTNDHDATDFLRALIGRIADDTGVAAAAAMARLVSGPSDSYAELVRHMAAEQRQKRAEENFAALAPSDLAALLDDGPPSNIDDLKALVCEELSVAQRKLLGDDLDAIVEFWTDENLPRNENRCRDRLASLIGPILERYNIQRITEADMPRSKRADLAFSRGTMQLPIEIKGQWHSDVWDAATDQLDVHYLVDWRSEQRGIYCVLWFGALPSATHRRLKAHPDGLTPPQSAEAMRLMLIDRLPDARRAMIEVVVLDLSAGHSAARDRTE